jgi:hypothetical protein
MPRVRCPPAEPDEADVVVGEACGISYGADRLVAQAGQDRRGKLLRVAGWACPGFDCELMLAVLGASQLCGSAAVCWVLMVVAKVGQSLLSVRSSAVGLLEERLPAAGGAGPLTARYGLAADAAGAGERQNGAGLAASRGRPA